MASEAQLSISTSIGDITFMRPDFNTQMRTWEHLDEEMAADMRNDLDPSECLVMHRIWWLVNDDCDGTTCRCGRVSLLEVLDAAPPSLHIDIVAVHIHEMRASFSHYWSGDALLSPHSAAPTADQISGACSGCITGGGSHVAQVAYESEALAVEFGEILARWPVVAAAGLNEMLEQN